MKITRKNLEKIIKETIKELQGNRASILRKAKKINFGHGDLKKRPGYDMVRMKRVPSTPEEIQIASKVKQLWAAGTAAAVKEIEALSKANKCDEHWQKARAGSMGSGPAKADDLAKIPFICYAVSDPRNTVGQVDEHLSKKEETAKATRTVSADQLDLENTVNESSSMKTLFESFRKWSNNSTALSEQKAVRKPGAAGTHPDQDGRPGPTVQNAEDAAELEDTINFQKAEFERAKGIIQTVYSRWRTYGSAGQEIAGLSLKKPQHKKILKGLGQLFFPLDRASREGTIGGPVMTSVGTDVNSMMDFEDADFEYWVYNPPRTHAGRNEKLFPGQSKQNIKEILMAIKLALKEANYMVPTISNQGREE